MIDISTVNSIFLFFDGVRLINNEAKDRVVGVSLMQNIHSSPNISLSFQCHIIFYCALFPRRYPAGFGTVNFEHNLVHFFVWGFPQEYFSILPQGIFLHVFLQDFLPDFVQVFFFIIFALFSARISAANFL